jgi:putative endonuclease
MARLDRAISCQGRTMQKGGWVYITTNKTNGTLYVGVTSDLPRRAHQHRDGLTKCFTKRYNLQRLVYAERHETIEIAIQRESRLKKWPRAWKIALLVSYNPEWKDLYEALV